VRVLRATIASRLLLGLLALAPGCGTLVALHESRPYLPYDGVGEDIEFLQNVFYFAVRFGLPGLFLVPFAALPGIADVPGSLVADTLLLPYGAANRVSKHGPEPVPEYASPPGAWEGPPPPEARHPERVTDEIPSLEEARAIASLSPEESWGVVHAIALSPDGTRLAACGERGLGVATVSPIRSSSRCSPVGGHALAWSADGKILAVASSDGDVAQYETTGWSSAADPARRVGKSISLLADGRLASVAGNLSLRLRFPATGPDDSGAPRRQVLSPDGQTIAAIGSNAVVLNRLDGTAPVWSRSISMVVDCEDELLADVAFSPDGSQVAVAYSNVEVVDAKTGASVPGELARHELGAVRVAYAPDGRTLAVGTWDGFVRIVSASSGRTLLALRPSPENQSHRVPPFLHAVAFARDGRRVFAAVDERVLVWDLPTLETPKEK
jgi:WD40 repeat protein/uncharacterized protein YceK